MLPSTPLGLGHYVNERDRSPFEDWFERLDAGERAKISVALLRLRRGYFSNVKPVGDGVVESRIDSGPGYRVYFAQDGGDLIVLLVGGTKRRQQKDIAAAKAYWADYKRRRVQAGGVWRPWC